MATRKIEKLREEATNWVEKNGTQGFLGPYPNRSCWHCNPSHKWMKEDMKTPYQCYVCGHIYFKGVRITE